MESISNIKAAVSAWNAAHPRQWPRRPGRCPLCLGGLAAGGCFASLPGSSPRWVCFSTAHGPEHGGLRGRNCFTGDALDVEAHLRGCTRLDVLRDDGYWPPPCERAGWGRP